MKLKLIAAISLSAFAFSASAQNSLVPTEQQPSFDYVQVAYQTYNIDNVRDDLNGFAVRGSVSFTEQFFGAVEYDDVSASSSLGNFRVTADLSQLYANLGYQFYQQGNTSAYFTGGVAWTEVRIRESGPSVNYSESADDTGFNLQIGLRHRFNEQLEVDANIRHVDIADGSDQILTLAGRYYVTQRFSIDARFTRLDSDISGYSIGASLHF